MMHSALSAVMPYYMSFCRTGVKVVRLCHASGLLLSLSQPPPMVVGTSSYSNLLRRWEAAPQPDSLTPPDFPTQTKTETTMVVVMVEVVVASVLYASKVTAPPRQLQTPVARNLGSESINQLNLTEFVVVVLLLL